MIDESLLPVAMIAGLALTGLQVAFLILGIRAFSRYLTLNPRDRGAELMWARLKELHLRDMEGGALAEDERTELDALRVQYGWQ